MFKYLLLICFICLFSDLPAQTYSLQIVYYPQNLRPVENVKLTNTYLDSTSVLQAVDEAVAEAQSGGYFLAEVKEIIWSDKKVFATIQLNDLYQLVKLENGNINPQILSASGYRDKLYANVPFNLRQLQQLFGALLRVYQNSGYPFASVGMDSITFSGAALSAGLYATPGRFITADTFIVAGNALIANAYLQSYLGIKAGSAYNEEKIRAINARLQELPFAVPVKNAEVRFINDKAAITVFLDKKNANRFDGILGFLPDDNTGKLNLTGDLKLSLQNVFRGAERLDFNFKSLPAASRELNLDASIPNLISTPLGFELGFDLYKQDTSFLNVNREIGVNYSFGGTDLIRFFAQSRSGGLVSVTPYQNAVVLPPFADVNTTMYGLGFNFDKLDYLYNPTKGYTISADFSAGKKRIRKNTALPEGLYDDVQLNSSQYRVEACGSVFIPLTNRNVVTFGNQTGILFGRSLFDNELYRIGGFNTLRGFDEQSIFAGRYTILNAEYRYLLEGNSFMFVFFNQGFTSRNKSGANQNDTPLGFGAGINFETRAGIVSLSYALGKQQDIPLNLQRGKIHFGIVTLF